MAITICSARISNGGATPGVTVVPQRSLFERNAAAVAGIAGPAQFERHAEPAFASSFLFIGFTRRAAAIAFTQGLVQRFDVRGTEGAGVGMAARRLSGGNMQKLILGRVLHGLGGGGLSSMGMVVLGDLVSPKDRGRYYTYFSAVYTTAGGGALTLGNAGSATGQGLDAPDATMPGVLVISEPAAVRLPQD